MRFLLPFLLLPIAAPAQTILEQVMAGRDVSEQEWHELTSGRTVIYEYFGMFEGREHYASSSNKTYYELTSGACIEGVLTYENNSFCFDWQGRDVECYYHKEIDGQYVIVGTDFQNIIYVRDFVDDAFTCAPEMLSMLEFSTLGALE